MGIDTSDIEQKINSMREVSVIMHYAVHGHEDIVSSNTVSFASITDTIDKESMRTVKQVWLNSLAAPQNTPIATEETTEDKFKRLLSEAIQATAKESLEKHFVRAAAVPIPSDYVVLLPVRSKMRTEIISSLVPFEKTRDMLLRLEEKLESPMRALQIGHAPVDNLAKLRARMSQYGAARISLN